MGNESSSPLARDEWNRSGGTVVTAGRPTTQRERQLQRVPQDAPEQRRLSHHAHMMPDTKVAEKFHDGEQEGIATDTLSARREPRLSAHNSEPRVHDGTVMSDFSTFLPRRSTCPAAIVSETVAEPVNASPCPESTGTPRSIMLHDSSLQRKNSAQSGQSGQSGLGGLSLERCQRQDSCPSRSSDDGDETSSEDSWSDDNEYSSGVGMRLLGVSDSSINSRRFSSTVDRDSKRVGFGFNSTTSFNRKVSFVRNTQTPHVVSNAPNSQLSSSEVADGATGLANSAELHSPATDGLMPLAHFGEGSTMSRHGSVSITGSPRGAQDTGCKRSAQSSVIFNDNVQVTDTHAHQDLLVARPNHRSALARRPHTRFSPNAPPLRHNVPADHLTRDLMAPHAGLRVLSLEHM